MNAVYTRTKVLGDKPFSWCAGCSHGIIQRIIAEVIDDLNFQERTIAVGGIGCASIIDFCVDRIGSAHGRAPATATGIKRCNPNSIVFTYQGDGDCTSIGCAEVIHAATRGEKITVIMANNTNYGMTGGQMSPTTLLGQKTSTSQDGRNRELNGLPIRMPEMIAQLDGAAYVARTAVYDVPTIIQTKAAIKDAFHYQNAGSGFTFVEVLAACPTNWGMSPIEAAARVRNEVASYYPIGVIKTP
jgi:2-oxoglutarate ferredoxin oxidoreductase subunit beta